jgi:3',5'-nucleoside bisphosphate phosphatase
MKRVRADWHIHTTLSPCASLEMDPATILRQARNQNLQIIGITDHNSTRQARMIRTGFRTDDLIVLTGAEITTREEIHCLAFFDDMIALDEFQDYLDLHLPDIQNNPDLFGDQVVVDQEGRILYEEQKLLISALNRSMEQVGEFVDSRGGIFIPAHVNRPAFSLLSQLGMVPANLKADALEWIPGCRGGLEVPLEGAAHAYPAVYSSDAHYPGEIGRRYTEMELEGSTFKDIKIALTRLSTIPGI